MNLGGANINVIKSVVANAANSLSIADAGTVQAFLDRWMQYLGAHAKHLRTTTSDLNCPVIVVHVDDCKVKGEALSWDRRPTLGTNTKENLAGMFAVVTDIGGYVNPQKLNATESFDKNIIDAGLGKSPTIMLTSLNDIYIWPSGIEGDDAGIHVQLQDTQVIDENLIDELLNNFHKHRAEQASDWWKDSSKFVVVNNPEKTVQHDLWIFLLQLAESARVAAEPKIDSGRADIIIRPRHPTAVCKSSILELKTIRSVRTPKSDDKTPTPISEKENIEWACAGVQQTASYRDAESFDLAFLCVYDFRKSDDASIETHIEANAKLYNVIHRRYWVTSCHEAYRSKYYPIVNA